MSLRRTACVADDQAAGVAGFSSAVATCSELVLTHRLPPFLAVSRLFLFALEVTVTSLPPLRLCRNAVFSIKPTFSLIYQWAGLENADFWATDLGSAVSNVVLRIVGQSVACAFLGD